MTRKQISIMVAVAYPLVMMAFMSDVLRVPFDPETVTRFITPFTFGGHDNLSWTVMESTQWDIFRPLYSLSVLLDHSLWGSRVFMYHVTDLLLSWICYVTVFLLLRRRFGLLTASAAVLLWALGPAQSMSMYRIFGRNDRLVTLFTVTALLLFDRASDTVGRKRVLMMAGVVLSVALATLSKETGIYYSLLLPLWSLTVLGRRFTRMLRSDAVLWGVLLVMGAIFLTARHLAGFSMAIDSEGFVTGADYVRNMSALILMGIPLQSRLSLNPYLVCGIAAGLVAATLAIRKVPASSRFGALAFTVFILPFPLLWVAGSFLWGFAIWTSLWAAGILSPIILSLWKRRGGFGRGVIAFFSAVVLILYGLWSGRMTRVITSPMIEAGEVAEYAVSTSDGPVYYSGGMEDRYGQWWDSLRSGPPRDLDKMLLYLSELVRLETGDPDACVVLSEDR